MKALRLFVLFISTLLPVCININAQNIDIQGYEIKFSGLNINDSQLFFQGYYGQEAYIFDSAKVKGHKSFTFKSKKRAIPTGIYTITDRFGNEYVDLIIDKDRVFSVNGGEWNSLYVNSATVTSSEENIQFIEFQKQIVAAEFIHESSSSMTENTPRLFYESTPESFLGHYIKAKYNINPMLTTSKLEEDSSNASHQYQQLIDHYFDHYNFSDARLLRTPIYLDMQNYFMEVLPQDAQFIVQKANELLQKFKDKESYEYYTALIISLFEHSINNMVNDQVFVELFDQHCKGKNMNTIPDDLRNYYQRSAERKRKLLPGKTIPALVSYDINNARHSTSEIDKENIILWFWDADCDECIEETPKLRDFYNEFANYYNLEVYAVAITDDLEKWDKFCKENELNWINVNYYMNEPNYDFIEYFDLIATPVIYLIDKNHTIISRDFPLEELHEELRMRFEH